MLNKLFYFSLFLLSLGQLGVIYKSGEVRIYAFDLALCLFVLCGFIYFLVVKKSLFFPKTFLPLFLFILWALVTFPFGALYLNSQQITASFFYLGRFSIYILSGLMVFNLIKQSIMSFSSFLTAVFCAGLLVSIAGFVQLIVLPDFTVLDEALGLDPHRNRLAATFLDPNFAGGFLGVILGLALSSLYGKQYKWSLLSGILFIVVPSIALFLTFSRSAWGMFAIIILLIGIFRSKWLLFAALFLAFSAYFAIPRVQTRISGTTDPADSAAFRIISWQNASQIASDNLLLGVGFNTYRYAQQEYGFIDPGSTGGNSGAGADSSLLLVLATTGIFGFILFSFELLRSIILNFFSLFKKPNFVSLAVLTVSCGLLLHSQFVNSLFYPPILLLWPIILSFNDLDLS